MIKFIKKIKNFSLFKYKKNNLKLMKMKFYFKTNIDALYFIKIKTIIIIHL
jgi:hypothetical protein